MRAVLDCQLYSTANPAKFECAYWLCFLSSKSQMASTFFFLPWMFFLIFFSLVGQGIHAMVPCPPIFATYYFSFSWCVKFPQLCWLLLCSLDAALYCDTWKSSFISSRQHSLMLVAEATQYSILSLIADSDQGKDFFRSYFFLTWFFLALARLKNKKTKKMVLKNSLIKESLMLQPWIATKSNVKSAKAHLEMCTWQFTEKHDEH